MSYYKCIYVNVNNLDKDASNKHVELFIHN